MQSSPPFCTDTAWRHRLTLPSTTTAIGRNSMRCQARGQTVRRSQSTPCGDKYAWYANYSGVAYARLGFVVLTYEPAGEGERNSARRSGTRAHDRVVPP